jgi:PAS domain S-box-containing protein
MTVRPAALHGRWRGLDGLDSEDAAASTAATDLINILDAVEVPVVTVRHDLTVAGFNSAAADLLGVSTADIGRALSGISLLAGSSHLEQGCGEVITGGVDSRVDLRVGDKWILVRISAYTRSDWDIAGAVLTFTDVTAFRASIVDAVYERESTKTIINTVADPLVVLGADQRVQSGNRAFYTMFGVSRDETQGTALYELGNGAFGAGAVRRHFDEMLAGSQAPGPVEVDGVVTARGQRTLSLDAHPLSFPGHSERRVLVTFQDITSRKQAEAAKDLRSEEELRRSEAFLAEGQRLSLTGSFSWKVATDEITWSDELYRIHELEIGLPVTLELIRTRVHPEDLSLTEKMKVVDQVSDDGNKFEWQYRLLMPDRSIKYMHAVAHATRDHAGELEYIAAVQDVTARRESEEALAKARSELAGVARTMSLGVLTASIAHEVNQPLSGIITNAGTCLRMLEPDPPNLEGARETARRTLRDGNRASDVITRLRALFGNQELTLELLDLNEVTREVIALSSSDLHANQVAFQSELGEDLPPISGDRIQLQQVILNLLRNASDAMLDVHDRPRNLLISSQREDDDRLRVSVRDSGVGFDAQNIDKLIDAFHTTKSDGMGIGLSVSRSIIERHQGRLWAKPNDGPGATVSFSIPSRGENATDTGPLPSRP